MKDGITSDEYFTVGGTRCSNTAQDQFLYEYVLPEKGREGRKKEEMDTFAKVFVPMYV